ncbi:hypothetical protein [Candidatus Macondimonas diazotrophica]|jgi:hypothetical protein|uniref:Uncharacterized protein n=1 Tax=Candidatus Macondimonas diazotrophica TaxID=2305248 RepID=A0A4Z0F6Y1_9GAMM|nr:hypothetical protein [Candidatus Macondimonas diazotrophica]TFZ80742.1 hypothetical protein E4680_13700 [Candidatus Macondimonas diazotrophica]
MKMTAEHYAALEGRIAQIVAQIPAHVDSLRTDPRVKDLRTRVVWDVYHSTRMHQLYSPQEWDYLDSHIETATKRALRNLGVDVGNLTK